MGALDGASGLCSSGCGGGHGLFEEFGDQLYVRMYRDGSLEAVMTMAYHKDDHPLADRFNEVR